MMRSLQDVERLLCHICAEVLQVSRIDPSEDLLGRGATSLSMILIITRLQEELQMEFSPDIAAQVLFKAPTVRSLASHVHDVIGRDINTGHVHDPKINALNGLRPQHGG